MTAAITERDFGQTGDGTRVSLFTLVNAQGLKAQITNYGGIVTSLCVPDRQGQVDDIVLGYDTLPEYLSDTAFFGAMVGRFANRIAKGRFTLDGTDYTLACNNGPNHLHGGIQNFSKVVWRAEVMESWLRLHYVSADGEEGYPGALTVTVDYALTDQNELAIVSRAETTKATPVNLTHHSYFNLAGAGRGDILDHELWMAADHYLPTDKTQIPMGELAPVSGTPFDFTVPTPVGARIGAAHPDLTIAGGYDHTMVVRRGDTDGMVLAVRVTEPQSGRVMEVWTTEPGVQLYTGNSLRGQKGRGGAVYAAHGGLCLEAQHFPDAPNQPDFPNTILRPGEVYASETRYRFLIGK